MMRKALCSLAVCSLGFSTPALAQGAPQVKLLTTPAGNLMEPLAGWRETSEKNLLRFDSPEGDLQVAVVDIGGSSGANAAVKSAWAQLKHKDLAKFASKTALPARRGWDQRVYFSYQTPPEAREDVYAEALQHGGRWTVVTVFGASATAQKREGDVDSAFTSLHPADYTPESFAGRSPRPLDQARIEELRSFVANSIETLGIPGASMALIDHGKVVFDGGFGVKQLGRADPIDAHTLFLVASNTKGMTTLLLARLVDQGKLAWNEPVVQAYPAFRVGGAALTSSIEMRDLVCACTGLPRQDLEWEFNTPIGTPASVVFTQLAGIKPTSEPGQVFQYNNQMPAAAGYIAGHLLFPNTALGAAYNRAMSDYIFGPLGMRDTTFSFAQALAGNVAQPYSEDVDGNQARSSIQFDTVIIPYRPAAGAWSSAHDMIKYVALELTEGLLPDGSRLVSQKNLLARRARRVSTGENQWYGMGLWEDANSGVSVIYHGGNMPGYYSDIDIIPSAQVGAVILTNSSDGNVLVRAFRRRLLEVLYDGRPQAASDVAFAARDLRKSATQERAQLTIPADPAVTARLARHYTNRELGPLEVRTDAAGTRLIANSMSSIVATRKNSDGSVSLVPISPGADSSKFLIGAEGAIPTLTVSNGQHVYVFRATQT